MQKHFTLQLYYNIGFSHPVMLLVPVGRRNTHRILGHLQTFLQCRKTQNYNEKLGKKNAKEVTDQN